MKTKLSIIVPVYNVDGYLSRCLDSLLAQEYSFAEFILVDDGSTDKSLEICEKFKALDARFKILYSENHGTSHARNLGLEAATGDYIGFVDSDDWIEPSMYRQMIGMAEAHTLDLVACDYKFSNGEQVIHALAKDKPHVVVSIEDYLSTIHNIPNNHFNIWSKIFRKELIKDMKFVYGKIHQDALFASEVYLKTDKIGLIFSPLYVYFIDNESISRSKYSLKNLEAIGVMLEVHQNFVSLTSKKTTKESIRKWFTSWLVNNYGLLCMHLELDKDNFFKSKLKSLIKENYCAKDKNVRANLATLIPYKFYGLFNWFYVQLVVVKHILD
jgi:glycosyltransferase involved in cell wall biosynthesis